jgi:hypothetical protein
MGKDRIDFELPLPSVSLKRFLLKAVRDDEFFEFALEDPLAAMAEVFAGLFGALGRLREMLGDEERTKFRFEDVFGNDAHIEGAMLAQQVERGICRDWDQREALMKQSRFRAFTQNFQREAEFDRFANLELLRPRSAFRERFADIRAERGIEFIRDTSESAEKFRGYDKQWDQADAVHNTHSTQNYNKSFGGDGSSLVLDLLRGPLMRARDLAQVAARLEVIIDARTQGM